MTSGSNRDLLMQREVTIAELRERLSALTARHAERTAELNQLDEAVAKCCITLESCGQSRVELGDLRRTSPLSPVWGMDRGQPVDRFYIDRFLARYRDDVFGRVLEVKDSGYTKAFGGGRVVQSDVLDIDVTNTSATILADLSNADAVGSDTFDCFILTQTLGVIYDVAAALRHAVRILKPGGVLLCTMPAAGRISPEEGLDGDYWRFTEGSIRRLLTTVLPRGRFDVQGFGNVLVCAAFLYGLAAQELTEAELDETDPFFPVVYTVRAMKPT